MKGLFELAERNYGEALSVMNRLLQNYPNGRKAPAAMFAKGILYKRLNLMAEAKETLQNVSSHYPGSPESMRAKSEMRILK
jgi:TolA-binding protein